MILLVNVVDEHGGALTQLDGPIIPEWVGEGDPEEGYYAGQPGTAYAKILEELWTDVSPSGAYWNPTRIVSDNRIPAFATAISEYEFTAPQSGAAEVEVTLLFRRAFMELMEQKGWGDPDIVMAQQRMRVK